MSDPREKNRPPDDTELAEVAHVFDQFEADLIKNFLESHGIPCLVRGQAVPFVYHVTVAGPAEFKVLVPKMDRGKAEELLAGLPSPDDEGGPEKPR
jgi:Putative prokaryotic signal transducing protein